MTGFAWNFSKKVEKMEIFLKKLLKKVVFL